MIDIKAIQQELMQELQTSPDSPARRAAPGDVIASLEHSLLLPDLTLTKLAEACRMAKSFGIAAVTVPPQWVSEAADLLQGSLVAVGAAIGIPSPLASTEAKIADVRHCTNAGAVELDIALDIGAIKSGLWQKAEKDFMSAAECAFGRAKVKASFEHGAYSDDEKLRVLELIKRSGAEYVKIQNLLSGHGARAEDVRYVRSVLGGNVRIKIDGGVKTLETALELLAAGADRLGLTATKAVAESALACR